MQIYQLRKVWEELVFSYTGDRDLIDEVWKEIYTHYTLPGRHYHNLEHIWALVGLIEGNKTYIPNHHALLLSAFYHDIIYDVARKDNKDLSAELAENRLKELDVDESTIALTLRIIMQTSSHIKTNNFDIDLFLDFDRYILSAERNAYLEYKDQIRKEYGIFSDSVYKNIRVKFLENYLSSSEIYYVTISKRRENVARENLEKELYELQLDA